MGGAGGEEEIESAWASGRAGGHMHEQLVLGGEPRKGQERRETEVRASHLFQLWRRPMRCPCGGLWGGVVPPFHGFPTSRVG